MNTVNSEIAEWLRTRAASYHTDAYRLRTHGGDPDEVVVCESVAAELRDCADRIDPEESA